MFCRLLQVFKLKHKCACPNACVVSPSGHSTKKPTATAVPTEKHPTVDPNATVVPTEKDPTKKPTTTDSSSKLNDKLRSMSATGVNLKFGDRK